jgi:hypothetical protein
MSTRQEAPQFAATLGIGVDELVQRLLADTGAPLKAHSAAEDLWSPAFVKASHELLSDGRDEATRAGTPGALASLPGGLPRAVPTTTAIPPELTIDRAPRSAQAPSHLGLRHSLFAPAV